MEKTSVLLTAHEIKSLLVVCGVANSVYKRRTTKEVVRAVLFICTEGKQLSNATVNLV